MSKFEIAILLFGVAMIGIYVYSQVSEFSDKINDLTDW